MKDFPIIRFEMESLRLGVMHAFNDHNNELSRMVEDTVNSTLTADWVQAQVNDEVRKCITAAIANLSNNYKLQRTLEDLISKSLIEIIKPNTD